MTDPSPRVVILAGPNGAGKTTSSRPILAETLGIRTFVNADTIAQGLSGFGPETVAVEAGRIMLDRLRNLANQRVDFAFETTLSGRSYANWIRKFQQIGYRVHLFYFRLNHPDLAVARVAERVRAGGHHIPEVTIRQRWQRSLDNLDRLYAPLVDSCRVFDNSGVAYVDTSTNDSMIHALRSTSRVTLLSHACIGNPIAISRDGKIVMLSPNEIFALGSPTDQPSDFPKLPSV